MTIIMGDNIEKNEADLVAKWLKQHHPNIPQHIKVEDNEYVVVVVNDNAGVPISYSVTKPTIVNVERY